MSTKQDLLSRAVLAKPDQAVLRDINLEVKPGQCVAILGATGSGKSILMGLIPRFYDVTAGRVCIDGIDVRKLNLDDLRRNIGLVFQESFLFSNTVAANIAFGHPEATPAQIEKAARIAAAHDFILALPKGYDTVLSESGNSLSGGQRQRLAIARAVLLEPAILLLDDPTAAIDSETEHEIFEALDRAIAGRTTFIVAHRLSTLRRADFIVVMENGRIVQRGTHEELMRVPGPVPARGQPAAGRPRQAPVGAFPPMKRAEIKDLNLLLVQRVRDEDDDQELLKPLEWGLIRRLFGYTRPIKRKFWILIGLTIVRSAQLPGLVWLASKVIAGPSSTRRRPLDHPGDDRLRLPGDPDRRDVPLPAALRPRDRGDGGQRAAGGDLREGAAPADELLPADEARPDHQPGDLATSRRCARASRTSPSSARSSSGRWSSRPS